MGLHAFLAMPFGTKDSGPGEAIDFDAVYEDLIKPALEEKGFEVFRADEANYAGGIRPDMFQELLLADLVVADISIENANVWYELGIRHALRKRGVVSIRRKGARLPFDVLTDRALEYPVSDSGKKVQPGERATEGAAIMIPDPAAIDDARQDIGEYAQNTAELWHGRAVSPVYMHLSYLQEPDWRQMFEDEKLEMGDALRTWETQVKTAKRDGQPEKIMVLADEAPSYALRIEAHRTAGIALMSLTSYKLALDQFNETLELSPTDLEARQKKAIVLGRLGKRNEARGELEKLLRDVDENGDDYAETQALLGRVEKEDWQSSWKDANDDDAESNKKRAKRQKSRLEEAVSAYTVAFERRPGHYYSGINAIALRYLHHHLGGKDESEWPPLAELEGGVRWAIRAALLANKKDYWARVSLADLEVLKADADVVADAYGEATAVADGNWFSLDSSTQQLVLMESLGFRPAEVAAGLKVMKEEMARLGKPADAVVLEPARVILFSGHMIDRDDRPEPRFPPEHETAAAQAIEVKLDEIGVQAGDVGLCGGACGGDILFAEACLQRGIKMEIRIPFQKAEFLNKSVRFAGEEWQTRFNQVVNDEQTTLLEMPEELGRTPKNRSPYARNNLWQLYSALCRSSDDLNKVHFLALWDGKEGDGEGGTQHMWDTVSAVGENVYRIDTNDLQPAPG